MGKSRKKRRKFKSSEEYIGFKLIKPVPQSSLLPDLERLKSLNIPSAMKGLYASDMLRNIIEKESSVQEETIDNQSDISKGERYQYQNDTSINLRPVSKLDQYQGEGNIEAGDASKKGEVKKEVSPIKVKDVPDTVEGKLKFKAGFFTQWESSVFNELRKVLTNSEFKIYTVLFEESWAYGRNLTNIIGYNVIAERSGLSRATVIRNIEKLIKRRVVERRTTFNNLGTIYKVNLPENAEVQFNGEAMRKSEAQDEGGSSEAEDKREVGSSWYQSDTSTSIKMIPVLVSNLYQSPQKSGEETIESQSFSKNEDIYNTITVHSNIYNREGGNFKYGLGEDEKFIFENNLIKVFGYDEVCKVLRSKPFMLKDEVVRMLVSSVSLELLSLRIHNAVFLYRKNLIKKPGQWLILSIYNNYKTSKVFVKYLKEKVKREDNKDKSRVNPVDEHMIKTVFGYGTKFLRVIPSKEMLIKELDKFKIPSQTIEQIVNSYPPEYVFFQIKHAEHRLQELKDPSAWLVNAIVKVYKPSREFAKRIESLIKELEEERKREERDRKLEEERARIEKALKFFEKLPKAKQEEIKRIAREALMKLNITPDTPGYKINFENEVAMIVLSRFEI